MTAIVGRRMTATEQRSTPKLPPIRNRFNFFYMVDPWSWDYDVDDAAGGNSGWLPRLGRMNLIAGVGGIGPHGETDLAIVARQREGWQVIMPSDPRLGDYMNYTQQLPSRGKTKVWSSIFESVNMIGNRATWRTDEAGLRAFKRHLVDSGIVADISGDVRESLIDERRARLEQHRGRLIANPNNPALATRIQAGEALLDAMSGKPAKKPTRAKR